MKFHFHISSMTIAFIEGRLHSVPLPCTPIQHKQSITRGFSGESTFNTIWLPSADDLCVHTELTNKQTQLLPTNRTFYIHPEVVQSKPNALSSTTSTKDEDQPTHQ